MIEPSDIELVSFTLGVGALATLLMLPFGVALGAWLARTRGLSRQVVETCCLLPLVVPPTAVGLSLVLLFQETSPLGGLLVRAGFPVLFTWKAAVLASAIMAFPLLVRAVRDAFRKVDLRLVAMARSLGDTRLAAFRRVALPLAQRGILRGTLLAFARASGEFGATLLAAGNIPGRTQTLSLALFARAERGDDAAALRLLGVAFLIGLVGVGAAELLQRRRSWGPQG